MSRGLGKVERAVLAMLGDWRGHEARLEAIAKVTGHHAESVRRAIKSLASKGHVELGHDNGWRDHGEGPYLFYATACPTARLTAEYSPTLRDTP